MDAAPRVLTEPPPPADERVAYGPHPLQFGDRYGDDPQVVYLHGGFWKPEYDLAHAGHACAALAAAGIPILSLDGSSTKGVSISRCCSEPAASTSSDRR